MDQPAHVPQLGDDPPAFLVYGVGNKLPAVDLRLVPETRRIGPAKAFAGDSGRFGDDQAGAGALRIVAGHQLVGHALAAGAGTGQRGHEDPVGKLKRTELERVEKAGHRSPFSKCRRSPAPARER